MKILAIETSCELASVALVIDGEIIDCTLQGHANHSEHLLPALQRLLAKGGVALTALDALAFGAGPGAFTGLRLACSVVQGLALGAGLGVVPVSSLAALSLQGRGGNVFVATDARMGEVYCAAYRCAGGLPHEAHAPACLPPQQVALPPGQGWYLIGSALRAHPDMLDRLKSIHCRGWDAEAAPRGRAGAAIAAAAVAGGAAIAPELAAPLYVRDKVALTTAERLARGGRA